MTEIMVDLNLTSQISA